MYHLIREVTMVTAHMAVEVAFMLESLRADGAREWSVSRVDHHVTLQTHATSQQLAAHLAGKGSPLHEMGNVQAVCRAYNKMGIDNALCTP